MVLCDLMMERHMRKLKWISFGVVALACVGLTGCASFEDRPLSPEASLQRFSDRTLDSNDLEVYLQRTAPPSTWPLPRWDLSQLTLAAFFYNPELDVARAHWAAAQAQSRTASETPNPTLGLSPGYNTTTGRAAEMSPWIVGVALDLPLDVAHQRGYRMAAAQSLSESARLAIAQAAWSVRHEVRAALLDLYAAVEQEENLGRDLKLASDKTALLEQWLRVGEISTLEVDQARAEQQQSRIAWLNAGQDKVRAQARLAVAIGIPVQALTRVSLDFSSFEHLPALPPAESRRNALLHRADLLAMLANYQMSQSTLQAAIAGQYPQIQIGPGYEFDQSEDKWSLGLSVSLPVFNRNQGQIAAAEAARQEAASAFQSVQTRIINQVEQAVTQYHLCLNQVRTGAALVRERQAQRDRMQTMLDTGQIVRTDLISAEQQLNASRSTQLEARVAALQSLGQLEDAMQTASDLPAGADIGPNVQTSPTRQGSGT